MRRVILVEDEVMVAMYVEDLLSELGHQVIALATNLGNALDLARTGDADFAVLDINLGGESSFPVAYVLRQRCNPFLFVSGYNSGGVEDDYRPDIRLMKPFLVSDLDKGIERLSLR